MKILCAADGPYFLICWQSSTANMIQKLHIQNYAIIDVLSIDFSGRMNVITGETGAGKSILMGALSLILGDRADSAVLLEKDKKCYVEGKVMNKLHKKIYKKLFFIHSISFIYFVTFLITVT